MKLKIAAMIVLAFAIGLAAQTTHTFGALDVAQSWTALQTFASVSLTTIPTVRGVATVSGGIPAEYGTVDLTTQGADITNQTAYAVPAAGAGLYRVVVYIAVTRAGTTSTMPTSCVKWTDRDSAQAESVNVTASSTGNALTTLATATQIVDAGNTTNIQVATGSNCSGGTTFASTGGTSMQYKIRAKVESF